MLWWRLEPLGRAYNPLDAAVIYYGRVTASAKSLATLSVPLLGHFGTMDKSINPEMVGTFQKRLSEAGKANMFTTHWYTAGHAFANPTGGRYDEDDAALGMGAHPYIFSSPSALGRTTTTDLMILIKGGSRQPVVPSSWVSLDTG